MPNPLLRPLLIFEFLVAIEAIFTFWSQVGGQYHLDLMYWPWKFGISVVAALLITAITAALVKSGGAVTGRIWALGTLLVATFAIAGLVTYYYHLHEPSDEDDTGDQTTVTWNQDAGRGSGRGLWGGQSWPQPPFQAARQAGKPVGGQDCPPHFDYHTRQEFAPRTIG